MSTTAFPVRQTSAGVGCTDIAMRKIFQALYPNKGIISGLKVTGQSALSYKITSGVAVCSKGSSDGNTLAYYEGGTVATTANTASNPRIDVIWITSHDVTQGDSDNLVTIGVTKGTAAASPTEPSIPSYATKLAAMKMPANATTTASATAYGSASQSIPYGGAAGLLSNSSVTYTGNWGSKNTEQELHHFSFSLASKRVIQVGITMTAGAVGGVYADGDASVYCIVKDKGSSASSKGTVLDTRELRLRAKGNAVSQYYMFTCELAAGKHYLTLSYRPNACTNMYFYYGDDAYPGQRMDIVDLGVAD